MNRKLLIAFAAIIAFSSGCKVQQSGIGNSRDNDPVLFSVDGAPVHVSEFKYIYAKTNANKADFSKASLEEYLDLYTKFKLKVRRAKEMRLDTVPTLRDELAGYRRQLSDSYLIDREVTDKLIAEAYERTKKDVDISHILVACLPTALPADSLKAYQKCIEAREKIMNGSDFASVAREYSDDPSKDRNGGHIGFITALFPNGLYTVETAAYSQIPGSISMPVRSTMGYHLVRVEAVRDARGEIEAAHILLRKSKEDPSKNKMVKQKIDSLYQVIKAGGNFALHASKYSEDHMSAPQGGNIGVFGINKYELAFENVAFSLANDGDLSEPVETSVGWHIIQRISRRGIEPFNIAKQGLQSKVKNDGRFELARRAMIRRIQRENNFTEYPQTLHAFITTLDSNFLTFKWKPNEITDDQSLFTLGKDTKVTVDMFEEFLARSSRQRIRLFGNSDNESAVRSLYATFVDEETLRHEERHLEAKYPDFKALMREYEEGILLFEAMRLEVWDKASQDTSGLKEFFKTIPGKYQWKQRAVVSVYTIKDELKDKANEVRAFVTGNSSERALATFNENGRTLLSVQERTFEEGKNEVLDHMDWVIGKLSANEINQRDNSLNFMKIEKILPAGEKTLEEARGYVVADYQDFLEKKWLEDLKNKYKVVIDQKVLDSLVKK